MRKYFSLLIILLSSLLLSACFLNKPFKLSQKEVEIEVGDEVILPVVLNKIDWDDLDFEVEDLSIANINKDEEGRALIQANKIGLTKLLIKVDDYEQSLTINVIQIRVHFQIPSQYLELGKSMIIFMENFDDFADFNWTNSNPEVGSLNEFNVFSALKVGKATITASLKSDATINGSITIEVVPLSPKAYVASTLLEVGDEIQILLEEPYKNLYKDFTWKIDNKKIISIDRNYRLKALREGTTTVELTLKANSLVKNEFEITVKNSASFDAEPSVGPLYIKPSNKTAIVRAGESLDYSVLGLIDPLKYRFQAADATIVGVTDMGVIWGMKEGFANIYVISKKDPSIRGTITVTVEGTSNVNYIERLISAALAEEGYVAGYNKANKYGEWFEYPNEDWCAMFVSWAANQAGIAINIIPKYSSVAGGMLWFAERESLFYKEDYIPKRGDIIFFASAGASHTGIVVDCDGETVYTIEGNTSNSVRSRSYPLNYRTITGYGIPAYPSYNN